MVNSCRGWNKGTGKVELGENYPPPFEIFENGSGRPSAGKVVFEAFDELDEVAEI
jgi:hypothetical protein